MKPARCFWLLLLLTHWAGGQPGRRPPITLATYQSGTSGEVSLRGHLCHLVDSTGRLSVRDVVAQQRAGRFMRLTSTTNRQDFGVNNTDVHWLFFELQAPANVARPIRLMLDIEYANLDELELLAVRGEQIERLGLTGDQRSYDHRPYPNNNSVFPIELRAGERIGYYLRVKQPHAILSFFVRLWYRPAFVAHDRSEYLLWGLFIGIVCIILVLNFVLLAALRDWIYAWYNGFVHFMTMHLFTDAGLSFQYLWPNVPRLNDFLPVYLYIWAAMLCQTTFMQYFIRQNRHNSRVFRYVMAFKWVVLLALLTAIAVPLTGWPGYQTYYYRLVSSATSGFVLIVTGLTVLSLVEASQRSDTERMVRLYGYALVIQFVGYLAAAIINFCQARGWPLPFDVETYVILGIILLFDLIFFTYGLTYRYRQAKERNQQLELNLLTNRQQAQQRVITSLEDEHRRLAQDLHDDLGPLLATTKGYLSLLSRANPQPLLQRAQMLIDEAADELRTLAHQLLPRSLGRGELPDVLAEAAYKVGRRGVPVQFVGIGTVRPLGGQREQLLFSMATQLMRHARHRAEVTEVTVQLLYHDSRVNLSVEDDGRSGRLSEADEANLQAKANLLKADLFIDATDAGNSIMVSLPFDKPVPA
ncbi:7TM-DISM domain-containing protein [Spirosoma montaniterrae]|uniref:Histidine kinase n=1 Tax=Spirosoma montaniterrae TaxID=1178516 RepID=A0A1P9WUZ4_9BACT|nr:7TM-DISM domain-containing protein [Spirosoma montaniterrae]AQG79179.1 hypothetical protein AWR27_07495 [Spirosoma montaniterrae]